MTEMEDETMLEVEEEGDDGDYDEDYDEDEDVPSCIIINFFMKVLSDQRYDVLIQLYNKGFLPELNDAYYHYLNYPKSRKYLNRIYGDVLDSMLKVGYTENDDLLNTNKLTVYILHKLVPYKLYIRIFPSKNTYENALHEGDKDLAKAIKEFKVKPALNF